MVDAEEIRRVGPWSIGEKLGQGGNATVFRAIRDSTEGEVALKVLNSTKLDREPYKRFVREIDTLRSIGAVSGVLPLIDAHLPEQPSKQNPAWLATPIARPLADSLAEATLDQVVAAIAEIAETLVRLKGDHGIAHRDLKPDNLYELEGQWVVGDFGLVAVPDTEHLTETGRSLGPLHFTACEMITSPMTADPYPADVYSLAKTLWVVATRQHFPPEGHQEFQTRGFGIADFSPHPHADTLDRLVDVATLIHPNKRPTMEQFAADLQAWAELSSGARRLETGDLGARIREKMGAQLKQEDIEQHLRDLGYKAVHMLQDLFRPIQAALKEVHPHPELNLNNDKLTRNLLLTQATFSSPDIVFQWQACDRIAAGGPKLPYSLRLGRSIEVTAQSQLLFRWHIQVGREGVSGGQYWKPGQTMEAPVGSVEAELMLQNAVAELSRVLGDALEAFAEHLPRR